MALYSSSGKPLWKQPLIFKIAKASRATNFFQKMNLEKSPWDDLIPTQHPVVFSTTSPICREPYCRLFPIMKTYGDEVKAAKRCDGDSGWLMLTALSNRICPYELKRGRQKVFLYSKGKNAAHFNDDSESSKCLSSTFSFLFLFLWTCKNSTSEVVA